MDHSEDNERVDYGVEQAERAERRRRSSSYAVVDTGVSSGVGPAGLRGLVGGDDDVGKFSVFFVSSAQPQFAKRTHWAPV